jgi:transcription elongation factor Elf1
MSVIIDRKFLLLISPKLSRFTQKKDDLYNFRCPLCGDSQKNKTKARGFIYRKQNDYFYMCHNCGASTSFYNFLEKVDSNLVKEYALERYKDQGRANTPAPSFAEFKTETPKFKNKLQIPTIASLPKEHYARVYVESRQIPKKFQNELYFAEDFKAFVESLNIDKEGLKEKDPRLVIPFYDTNKNLLAIQGRSLGESKLRYITVKLHSDFHKVYGLDRINQDEPIYVTEGPIDSMFLNNAVATADSNLEAVTKVLDKSKVVLIFDNEPRNKEICKQMEQAIDNHFSVVVWPAMITSKDINDMVLIERLLPDEIEDIISKHTFVNLRAKAEFVNWKKT